MNGSFSLKMIASLKILSSQFRSILCLFQCLIFNIGHRKMQYFGIFRIKAEMHKLIANRVNAYINFHRVITKIEEAARVVT